MGRVLKRVALDFEWPLNKIWKGYLNPYLPKTCKKCKGSGGSERYNELKELWYNFDDSEYIKNPYVEGWVYNTKAWCNNLTQEDVDALVKEDRLWNFTRVPINKDQEEVVENKLKEGKNSWLPYNNGYKPTAKEVNEWALKGMGHDGLNAHICIKARCIREGFEAYCVECDGTGDYFENEELEKNYNNWHETEPPKGEGYQLWEDTSEGSPLTPVFKSIEELAGYCEDKTVSVFASHKLTKEEWIERFKEEDFTYRRGNMFFV